MIAEHGSRTPTYRRTQAGERKLALLRACAPARPSREGQRAPAPDISPAPPSEFAPLSLGEFGICGVGECLGAAKVRFGGLLYCRDHGRRLVISLENALAFAEGEG